MSLNATLGLVRHDDAVERLERAVVELHRDAVQRAERGRDLEQLQDHGLVRPEELAGCDPKRELITDLACGAGNGDANRRLAVLLHDSRIPDWTEVLTGLAEPHLSRQRHSASSSGASESASLSELLVSACLRSRLRSW